MYRECAFKAPGAAIGAKVVQEPSEGTDVSPVRTLIATLVPAGVALFHWMLFQFTPDADMESNTREKNVPAAV